MKRSVLFIVAAVAATALVAHEGCNMTNTGLPYHACTLLTDWENLQDDTVAVATSPKMLDEVIVCNGKRRKARLGGKGMKVPGTVTSWNEDNIGCEVGSIVKTKRLFEISEITFSVIKNRMKGAKASVNLYVVENDTFRNVLRKPIYVDIPLSDKKQEFCVAPDERTVIGAGEYYLSLKLVECDRENSTESERMLFPLYLKKSYIRNSATEEPEKISVGLGMQAAGFEYR